jgi:hypothetical protein
MLGIIYPLITFIFILSLSIVIKFIVSLSLSVFSNPPKKYEFKNYEQTLYIILISYIITFLIYI